MTQKFAHEETYRRRSIASRFHRNRLRSILDLFDTIELDTEGVLADFGCSNGFIIQCLQQRAFAGRNWRYVGWDASESLLSMARAKDLPRSRFCYFDLNNQNLTLRPEFDVVTCFETLEHVGDCQTAMEHLYRACKPGGRIVLSVPNEYGPAGIAKYFGRRLLRKNVYDDFFKGKSELRYVLRLLTGRRIDDFRHPSVAEWGPHLGFDARIFEKFVCEEYVDSKRCKLILRKKTSLGFNLLVILEKCQEVAGRHTDDFKSAA